MIHAPSADYGHRACCQLLLFHGGIRRGIAQGGTAVHTVIFGDAETGEESTHVGIVAGLPQLVNPAQRKYLVGKF